MQSFLKSGWQRRLAALSLGGVLTATPLMAQLTTPQPVDPPTGNVPKPVVAPQPVATPPRTPVLDALKQNRETREQNRENREATREQNRDNRELNRDTRKPALDAAERRERVRERLGFALNAVANGLTVSNIQQNSVFGGAGIRNDDVILRVGDHRFTDNAAFYNWVTTVQPGQPIAIVVQRGGREETINWTPTEQWTRDFNADYQHVSADQGTLGITLDARQPQAAIVAEVAPGSLADRAGIRPHDQIDSLNGEKIRSAQEFNSWAARLDGKDKIDLGFTRIVTLTSVAKPVTSITIPLPDRRDPPATLPMPVTPRAPQPNPSRIDPSQANPGVPPLCCTTRSEERRVT